MFEEVGREPGEGVHQGSSSRPVAQILREHLEAGRLRELEEHGLIEREVVPTMPVQISYTPTDRGLDLVRALQPLFAWGLDVAEGRETQRRGAC